MKKYKIPLFDNARKTFVDAWLVEGIDLDKIAKVNAKWARIKREYRDSCRRQGISAPEHSHWNWENKAEYSALFDAIQTRFAIVYRNEIQGLMLVERLTQFAKLPPNKGEPIIYVKFLEVAPQNIAPYADPREFLGVGALLLNAAIVYSKGQGFNGRIGLHALPQAEKKYEAWGMTRLDCDPDHEGLCYFELTSEQAVAVQTRFNISKRS